MPNTYSSIIDNRDDNTLLAALTRIGNGGEELLVASAFFSLDALLLLADSLGEFDRIRILFGDDASPKQRWQLLQKLRLSSDADLLSQREKMPLLSSLQKVEELFASGRVEARCYTSKKFHAKAYLIMRPNIHPSHMGVIGSGNFTRPGLMQNVELNVELTPEQTSQLRQWYDERWEEAAADVVTQDVLEEIRRQIDLYDPYYIYLKALYSWGQYRQGVEIGQRTKLLEQLDKHQEDGYLQALSIIERQNGVMVCDGVGLGKSFIALAIMEHFCRNGSNVLLLAPKSILSNSWEGYLKEYLAGYRSPFGNIHEMPMTALGFEPDDGNGDILELLDEKNELVRQLFERSDVIVLDESHNFRTRSSNRYQNLYRIVEPSNGKRKKVILLTATPINTAYTDISSQIALITHEKGCIGAYSIEQIRRATRELDNDRNEIDSSGQMTLQLVDTPNQMLNKVLEQMVIQRSRTTCKELSKAAGRELRFPIRKDPVCIEYQIEEESKGYGELIELADRLFRPGVKYLEAVRKELDKLKDKDIKHLPQNLMKGPPKGIKLAAFLLEQYRCETTVASKQYHDEVHLAGLVFANALKQLESSPAAFQGIIQSIGTGLIARLQHVFGDEASDIVAKHLPWVKQPIFDSAATELLIDSDPDTIEDGDALDASGAETDAWLQQAIRSRKLDRKLHEFEVGCFDTERWKNDIIGDLKFLRDIHDAIRAARKQPDPKLKMVCPAMLAELNAGNRVLLFTQSQRTAEYLEREMRQRLKGYNVARIDSRVEDTRAAIIHAFCPGYNKAPERRSPSIPERIDVLISTDVLSEGVNLQEAGAILNYDIHWNPVRLIQRIGRVDRRLDSRVTPGDHEFSIYNVLPPKEIEKVISLIESVERRTMKISRALGIDVSFFKASDPAGTLKEFNSYYEGDMSCADVAATQYVRCFDEPDPALLELLDAIPLGAFGVWSKAPVNGLFAMFTMEPTPEATDRDKAAFSQVIGQPVLILQEQGKTPILDSGKILGILSDTAHGEHSGNPSPEADLVTHLRKLKDAVRREFASVELPRTILPRLVCWLELRKEI